MEILRFSAANLKSCHLGTGIAQVEISLWVLAASWQKEKIFITMQGDAETEELKLWDYVI